MHFLPGCVDDVALPSPPADHSDRERAARLAERGLIGRLHALPNAERQLLHHYYVHGLTMDQLATIYGCSRSVAEQRVARSLATLQATLPETLSRSVGADGG